MKKRASRKSTPKKAARKKPATPKKKALQQTSGSRLQAPDQSLTPQTPSLTPQASSDAYERHKERTRLRQRALANAGKEIGPLPEVEDPQRRAAAEACFKTFLTTYFGHVFYNDWSQNQLDLIARCQRHITRGGMHAVAYPRGEGKSVICELACVWAILRTPQPGELDHHYVFLLCATSDKFSDDALESLRSEFESNDLLYEDFPEFCHPVRALEGQINRQRGQLLEGEPTWLQWNGKKRIILPTVPGTRAKGQIIGGGGMKVRDIRGSKVKGRDGRVHRPSLVMADDVQNDESADSLQQTAKYRNLIFGAVLGMAGPSGELTFLFPCTIIQPGDLADQFTDREQVPEMKGARNALLTSWPVHMELWEQYQELRREELQGDEDLDSLESDPTPQASAWLRERYTELHEGATVSNPARGPAWRVSTVQFAMHLYFRNPLSFWSEYQNWIETPHCPSSPLATEDLRLEPTAIAVKLSGYDKGVLPLSVEHLTGFVDCHDRVLYWMICGWSTRFDGWIVDYGTFPETRRQQFYVASFRPTLKERFPGAGTEGALTAGLDALSAQLLDRRFKREDGVEMTVSLIPVDSGYQTNTIKQWIRTSRYRDRLISSFGREAGPEEVPMSAYKQRAGERLGADWLIRLPTKGRTNQRHLLFDTYVWKSFCARRLKTAKGDAGAVTLYGRDGSTLRHDFLARHLTSEQASQVSGSQGTVDLWKRRPGESENHWWDCFVGSAVAASIQGAKLGAVAEKPSRTVKKTLAERRAEKRRGR